MSDAGSGSAASGHGIRDRSDLIDALSVGCELEHGLCLQYLFTAFTLKDAIGEGLTPGELTAVRKWKANILLVAAQEMLHLGQAANLLTSVGGTVQLQRPNFPQSSSYYPTRLPWGLFPFSRETMRVYALYERPARPTDDDARLLGASDARALQGLLLSEQEEARLFHEQPAQWKAKLPHAYLPERLHGRHAVAAPRATTIGELYASIGRAFEHLEPRPGGALIIGSPHAQADGTVIDFPQIISVTDRARAVEAVRLIVHQGEGSPGDRIDSHFGVFVNIVREYDRLKQARPDFEPARDVHPNPLSRLHTDNVYPGWRLISDPFTNEVNQLCSDVYQAMMAMLYRFFATPDEVPARRRTWSRTSIHTMATVIKPLGEALTKLPMGDDGSAGVAGRPKLAGPSFELDRNVQLLPFETSAWRYVHERLLELAARAQALVDAPRARQPAYAVAAPDLAATAAALTRIADGLGARRDAPRGA